MEKLKKLGKDFGLLTIGSFASKILTFLLVPLYTAQLTTAEYGVVDIINTTVNLVYPIAILVISEAVIRFCLDSSSDLKQVWTIGILITGIGCLVATAISPVICLTSMREYYIFFILQLWTISFNSTISQFAKGLDRVTIYAGGGIISTVVIVVLNLVLLLRFNCGLKGYLIALISGHIASTLFYVISLKLWRYNIGLRKIDKNVFKKMIKYSVPMIPNSISWWISDSSDKYVVKFFCGLSVNGIYALAYKIPSLLSTISTLFVGAWQISAFEDFNSKESRHFFSIVTNEYIKLNILIASGLIFLTKPIARIMFSADFYEAWRYTPVLILAYLFYTTSSFWGTIYTAAKKTNMLFYSTVVAAIGNIVLDLLLTPRFGAMGAAFATMVSYFIVCSMRMIDSRKIMTLDIEWKVVLFELLLIVLQILIISLDNLPSFVICGVITCAILIMNRTIFEKVLKMIGAKIIKK